jgi:DNA-binding transcriptional LysR family regulator
MEPTPYALQLAEPVAQALGALQQALNVRAAFDAPSSTRRFTLAMTDVGEMYFLPVLVDALTARAPGVTLQVVSVTQAALKDEMATGRIDLALGLLPQLQAGFYQQALFRQDYVALMRKGHRLARPGRLTLEAFMAAEHVRIEAAGTGHGRVDLALEKQQLRRRFRLTVPHYVALGDVHRTPQFWLVWTVLLLNVSASIGIIGLASPMVQEVFGGRLFGADGVRFGDFTEAQKTAAAAAGAGFVGLISLFNIFGRIIWASSSDHLGRKPTYLIFFVLGIALYLMASVSAGWKSLAIFVASFCVIASMYGGGFATIPAYLADMFGTQFVGAIHGRLLTAWSTAGILGPVVVNYMHDIRLEQKVPFDQIYEPIFYVLAAMLVVGLLANLMVRPVAERHFMSAEELAHEKQLAHEKSVKDTLQGEGQATKSNPAIAWVAWLAVGIPLAYGISVTLQKSAVLFK